MRGKHFLKILAVSGTFAILFCACGQKAGQSSGDSQPEKSSSAQQSSQMPSSSVPQIDKAAWNLVLMNPDKGVDGEYPVDLTDINANYDVPAKGGSKVDARIAEDLIQMVKDAKTAGVNLFIRSTHRTYATQKLYYDNKYNACIAAGSSADEAKQLTEEYLAIPGHSEHQTGLALDIISVEWQNAGYAIHDSFDETKAFVWLHENSPKYGFIMRYSKEKEAITKINYEPWHYRYVGKEYAQEITDRGICLEEFLGEA